VFASKWEEGGRGVFCVSMVLRVGEWMGERVSDFFHSSQNEEICEDECRMVVFYQNILGHAFYYNIKINIT